ncbi:hypothetical protein JD276_08260 [Leucobacter sp. CSA1]|uniref:Uncharacterized protein n=1 Tax=Leucobacter chromiisoli TaxID=2796471 RepID=A0A934UVK2_9MICO|nr:hypothetical protein [Leucobacter chromiisoli]MBK0419027.1 hypothetical protein [Leucobacter chromiisoli]
MVDPGSSPLHPLLEIAQAVPWTLLAVLSYAVTIAVGTLSMRGHRIRRRWHSRLFILTCALTVVAAILSFPEHWIRGLLLAVALVPLALLPFLSAPVRRHPSRHVAIGLSVAPCYLAALTMWAVQPR